MQLATCSPVLFRSSKKFIFNCPHAQCVLLALLTIRGVYQIPHILMIGRDAGGKGDVNEAGEEKRLGRDRGKNAGEKTKRDLERGIWKEGRE